VKQRGRKSKASLSVVGGPRLVSTSPPDNLPPPPEHLGEPEKQVWRDILRDWKGTDASLAVLASGLEVLQRARECREIIAVEGMTVTGRDGQTLAHPLLLAERASHKQFQQTLRQLGIKF
jgi:P27 family predicted phage terminase small subunit